MMLIAAMSISKAFGCAIAFAAAAIFLTLCVTPI